MYHSFQWCEFLGLCIINKTLLIIWPTYMLGTGFVSVNCIFCVCLSFLTGVCKSFCFCVIYYKWWFMALLKLIPYTHMIYQPWKLLLYTFYSVLKRNVLVKEQDIPQSPWLTLIWNQITFTVSSLPYCSVLSLYFIYCIYLFPWKHCVYIMPVT